MTDCTLPQIPSTRQEAFALGSAHFFTGQPCRNGHVAKRFTSDKSCALCRRERSKQWFREHKEAKRQYDANYNKTHRKAKTEVMKRWAKRNPRKTSVHMRNAYALRKEKRARGKLSMEVIGKLLKEQSNKCPYCRNRLGKSFHLDHIVALSKGGTHELKNWQLLRGRCNTQKGNRDAIDFARSKGLLL